jgi:hypothetical protein
LSPSSSSSSSARATPSPLAIHAHEDFNRRKVLSRKTSRDIQEEEDPLEGPDSKHSEKGLYWHGSLDEDWRDEADDDDDVASHYQRKSRRRNLAHVDHSQLDYAHAQGQLIPDPSSSSSSSSASPVNVHVTYQPDSSRPFRAVVLAPDTCPTACSDLSAPITDSCLPLSSSSSSVFSDNSVDGSSSTLDSLFTIIGNNNNQHARHPHDNSVQHRTDPFSPVIGLIGQLPPLSVLCSPMPASEASCISKDVFQFGPDAAAGHFAIPISLPPSDLGTQGSPVSLPAVSVAVSALSSSPNHEPEPALSQISSGFAPPQPAALSLHEYGLLSWRTNPLHWAHFLHLVASGIGLPPRF